MPCLPRFVNAPVKEIHALLRILGEEASGLGYIRAAMVDLKKLQLQAPFDYMQALAYSRLRHAHTLCSLGQGALLRERNDQFKVVDPSFGSGQSCTSS
jgi:hypothetical protein